MIVEYLTKVGGAFSKVLAGDLVHCCTDFYYGKERVTNGLRVAAILTGAVVGVLLMTYVIQDLIKTAYSFITDGGTLNEVVIISLNNAMGIMLGSRALDMAVKGILACRYQLTNGDTREMYKKFSYQELEVIHNGLANQPGSSVKSIAQYRLECSGKDLSDAQITEAIHTVLDGTGALLKQMKQRIITHKPYCDDVDLLNRHWQMVRLGQIGDVCLLDSYVANLLREAFDLKKPDGRSSVELMRRLSRPFVETHETKYEHSQAVVQTGSFEREAALSVIIDPASFPTATNLSSGSSFENTVAHIENEQTEGRMMEF